MAEHFQDLKDMKEENPLVKHMLLHHPGDSPEFSIKAEKSYKTSLGRQIGEAMKIGQSNPLFLMNSKSEWGGNKIPRVVVEDEGPPPQPSPEPHLSQPKSSSSNFYQSRPQKRKKTADIIVIPTGGIRSFLAPVNQLGHGMKSRIERNDMTSQRSDNPRSFTISEARISQQNSRV